MKRFMRKRKRYGTENAAKIKRRLGQFVAENKNIFHERQRNIYKAIEHSV